MVSNAAAGFRRRGALDGILRCESVSMCNAWRGRARRLAPWGRGLRRM